MIFLISCLISLFFTKSDAISKDSIIVQVEKHPIYQKTFNIISPIKPQELSTFLKNFTVYGSRFQMLVHHNLSVILAEKDQLSYKNKLPYEVYDSLLEREIKQINIPLEKVQESFKRYKIQYFGISGPLKEKTEIKSIINRAFKEASINGFDSAIKKFSKLKQNSQQFVFHDIYDFSKESIDSQHPEFQVIYNLPMHKFSPVFNFVKNNRIVSGFCKIIDIKNLTPYDFNERSAQYLLNYKKREARKKLLQKFNRLIPYSLKWNNDNFHVLYQLYSLNHTLGTLPEDYKAQLINTINSAIKASKTTEVGKCFGLLTAYHAIHEVQNISYITEAEKSKLSYQLIEVIKDILASEKNHFEPDVKIHLELVKCLEQKKDFRAKTYLLQAAENVNKKDISSLNFILEEAIRLKTKHLLSSIEFKKISDMILKKRSS